MITAKSNIDGTVDLVGKQGTTWNLELELYQDTAGTVPFDLTNYDARGQYRKDYKPTSPILLSFTCSKRERDDISNPHYNKLLISATPSQSTTLIQLSGVYDVEVYKSPLIVERVMEGKLTITPEVTRDV